MSDAIDTLQDDAEKKQVEWNYTGDFNEIAGMLIYSITMKYLVNEGRVREVTNPELMAAAAEEIGLSNEKIADVMIKAGKQLKEAIEFEKALEEYSELASKLYG